MYEYCLVTGLVYTEQPGHAPIYFFTRYIYITLCPYLSYKYHGNGTMVLLYRYCTVYTLEHHYRLSGTYLVR